MYLNQTKQLENITSGPNQPPVSFMKQQFYFQQNKIMYTKYETI